ILAPRALAKGEPSRFERREVARLYCGPRRRRSPRDTPLSEERSMPRPTRTDFYDIDSLLSEDERHIRDAVGDWVDERFLPIVEEAYDEAYFPKQVIPQVASLGLLGATLPEKYGCAGIG